MLWTTPGGNEAPEIRNFVPSASKSPFLGRFSTVVRIRAEFGLYVVFLFTNMLRAPGSQDSKLTWAFLWATACVQESKSEAPAPSESSSDAGRVKTVDARHA